MKRPDTWKNEKRKQQKRIMEEAEWKILPASTEKVCKMVLKGEIK